MNNCNATISIPLGGGGWGNFLAAPRGTWWACTFGLTPCLPYWKSVSENGGHQRGGLCILTHILPQVYYYSGEGGREHARLSRHRRAPILVPLLLGLGVAGSAAVGTTALVRGNIDFLELSRQTDSDLGTPETTVSRLEESPSSLAEVVLQNRRGLDLLFMKQGGLCMALGEACCFYANHSGVVKDGLSQLHKRLADRVEARGTQGNWYQSLFSWSPWLTTLVTAMAGPLSLLLLVLAVGPCVFKSIMHFVTSRTGELRLMLLTSHYQEIPPDDDLAESRI